MKPPQSPATPRSSAGAGDADVEPAVLARRSRWTTLAKAGFAVIVLVCAGFYIGSRWNGVTAALRQAAPGWVVAALLFGVAGQWMAMLGFRAVLQAVAPRPLPIRPVAEVYFVSQLGKYVPGSVWPIVALSSMGRRFGIAPRASATAGVLSLLFSLATGSIVGALLTVIGAAGRHPALWWLIPVPVLALGLMYPPLVRAGVERALRLLRRQSVDLDLSGPVLRGAVGWSTLSWVLLGTQCWCLVVALGFAPLPALAPAIGGFALAYVAGTLFIPAPGGVGVRETVMALALSGLLAGGTGSAQDAIVVVVLLSRVLLAVLDLAQAGVAWWLARLDRRRAGAEVS